MDLYISDMHDLEYLLNLVTGCEETVRSNRLAKEIKSAIAKESNRMLSQHSPRPIAQSEYPLTMAAIRQFDGAVNEMFVLRLVQNCIQTCMSRAKFPPDLLPKLDDELIAAMCTESFRTGPKNHRAGLLNYRVPDMLVSWGMRQQQEATSSKRCARCEIREMSVIRSGELLCWECSEEVNRVESDSLAFATMEEAKASKKWGSQWLRIAGQLYEWSNGKYAKHA